MAAYHKVEVTLNSQAVSVGLPSPQSVRVTLPLVGPQGPVGEAGPVGPEGPQGVPGTGLEVLTTQGDILYQGASVGERLPIGAEGEVLKVESGVPAWGEAGEAYDQSLNTTDSVEFAQVTTEVFFSTDQFDVGGETGISFSDENGAINTRRNLGLGTAATSDAGDFAAAVHGHAAADITDFNTAAAAAAPVSSVAGRTGAITLAVADVSGAVADTDARLSDSRTPTSHAASHLPEGADELFDQDLNTTDTPEFAALAIGNDPQADFGSPSNSGNARFLMNVDSGNNPSIELHTGATDFNQGSAAYIDFASDDNSDFNARIIYWNERGDYGDKSLRIQGDAPLVVELPLADFADSSKQVTLDLSGITEETTHSIAFPDASGTLALTSDIPDPSAATPQALGTAAAGTSDDYSRGDHVHAAPALNDLSNVSAATPSDNDVLVFDTATSTWVAAAPSGGGSGEVRSDFVSPYTYTGLAAAGTSESTASWTIRRPVGQSPDSFLRLTTNQQTKL